MTANHQKIMYIMERADRNANLCAICYKLISDAPKEEQWNLLKMFCECYGNEPCEETLDLPAVIEKNEEQQTVIQLLGTVASAVNGYVERELPENAFYEQLWAYISESDDFQNDTERICALLVINLSNQIPYVPINKEDMVSMEQDEYVESMATLKAQIKRMDWLIKHNFEQKTQQASLLLRELEQIPDFRLRTVFLSQLMERYHARANIGSLLGGLALRSLLEKEDND